MNEQEQGRILHDRATRGLSLTESEQIVLAAWYKSQDDVESALLSSPASSGYGRAPVQVEVAIAELPELGRRIQGLIRQNNLLRQENANLQQQLASGLGTQAA